MSNNETVITSGDKLKKALQWVSEMQSTHPEKKRIKILEEAQVRFNLSPRDCEFLNDNFS